MADVRRRMVAEFDASTAPFNAKLAEMKAALAALQGASSTGFKAVDENAKAAVLSLGALQAATIALGSSAVVGAFLAYADAGKMVDNQLRGIGASADVTKDKVYRMAIETRSPLEATVGLLRTMQKSLGDSQGIDKTISQVATLNRLLVIGGLNTAERGSVTLQFGQALQSGILGGDELRALREAAPAELLQAIAKEAGGTVQQLRALGAQGKLTRDVMVRALDDLEQVSKDKFGKFNMTISDGFEILRTGLIAATTEIDKSVGATNLLAQTEAALGRFLLDNAQTAGTFAKAMHLVFEAAAALAGTAGIFAVVNSVRSLTTAIGGAQVAFRFFGGPLALAIAAVGFAMIALHGNIVSVEDATKSLQTAMSNYSQDIDGLKSVNADLLTAKGELVTASDQYKEALAKEGPAAQAAAAAEISSVNDRIAALDKLREAKLGQALIDKRAAEDAEKTVTDILRRQVSDQLREATANRLNSASGRGINGMAAPQRDPSQYYTPQDVPAPAVAEIDAAMDGVVKDRIAKIEAALQGGSYVSDADKAFYGAVLTAKSASANFDLLRQKLEEVKAGAVTAGANVKDAFNMTATTQQLTQMQSELATLTEQALALRTALANPKGFGVTGYEGGQPVQAGRDEATAQLVQVDAQRAALAKLLDTGKALATAEIEVQTALTSSATAMEEARKKVASLTADRKLLVATYGEESPQVAQADAALARINAQMVQTTATTQGLIAEVHGLASAFAGIGGTTLNLGSQLATAEARLAAAKKGISRATVDAGEASAADVAPLRQYLPTFATDAIQSGLTSLRVNIADTTKEADKLFTAIDSPTKGGGGATKLDNIEGHVTTLNEAMSLANSLIASQQTAQEKLAEDTQRTAEARALLVDAYGKDSAVVSKLDLATKRLGDTTKSVYADMLNQVGQMIIQGKSLGDILTNIAVQFLQMNGMDAFKSLLSGGGLSGFFSTLVGGVASAGASAAGTTIDLTKLTKMANGGINYGPTLTMSAEAGVPEAFVPLPDGRTIPVTLKSNVQMPSGRSVPAALPMPDLMRAVAASQQIAGQSGGGGFSPEIHIHENAADQTHVETNRQTGRIDVFLRKTVSDMIDGGGLDGPMKRRFGAGVRSR